MTEIIKVRNFRRFTNLRISQLLLGEQESNLQTRQPIEVTHLSLLSVIFYQRTL